MTLHPCRNELPSRPDELATAANFIRNRRIHQKHSYFYSIRSGTPTHLENLQICEIPSFFACLQIFEMQASDEAVNEWLFFFKSLFQSERQVVPWIEFECFGDVVATAGVVFLGDVHHCALQIIV